MRGVQPECPAIGKAENVRALGALLVNRKLHAIWSFHRLLTQLLPVIETSTFLRPMDGIQYKETTGTVTSVRDLGTIVSL